MRVDTQPGHDHHQRQHRTAEKNSGKPIPHTDHLFVPGRERGPFQREGEGVLRKAKPT